MSLIDRPEPPALLLGLARFLEEEVKPAIPERGLSYRCLVAASLCKSLAAELSGRAATAEPGDAGPLDPTPGSPDWERVKARLAARLRAINPRFDLSEELP